MSIKHKRGDGKGKEEKHNIQNVEIWEKNVRGKEELVKMVCIRMEIKHSNIARHVTKEGRRKTKQAHGDIAKTRQYGKWGLAATAGCKRENVNSQRLKNECWVNVKDRMEEMR